MWNFLKRLRFKILVAEFVLSAGFVADIFCLCFDFRYNFIVVFAGEHSTWLSERSRVVLVVILFFRHLHLKFLKLWRRRYWTTSLIHTRADIWLTTWKLCHMRNDFPSTPLVQLFFGKKTTWRLLDCLRMSDLLLQPSVNPSSLIAKKGALFLKKQKLLTEIVV